MLSNIELLKPLASSQLNKLTEALQDLNPEQRIWLSGYLAGQSLTDNSSTTIQNPAQTTLTVLYGSQTGNCRLLAEGYMQVAQSKGINTQLISLADYKPRAIAKEKNLVLIISTHGEGDAPDDAEIFYEYLFSDSAPNLKSLNYSLLALGDSSYDKFCQTGIDIDQQLIQLGATAVVKRIDCDIDFEDQANNWQQDTLKYYVKNIAESSKSTNITPLSIIKTGQTNTFNRNNTYSAEVLAIQKITSDESIKNVYHVELSIEDSGIDYQPGDSLGILAKNNPQTVGKLINLLGSDPDKKIILKKQEYTLNEALSNNLEITLLHKSFLKFYAQHSASDKLLDIVSKQESFKKYISSRQLIDVLSEFPAKLSEQQLVDNLIKITPRLYSISSSLQTNPDEVHLTVALVKSSAHKAVEGLVSGLLCTQTKAGDFVSIYVESNRNFKLPDNPESPILMIAAGTGIAPYRAFLQQRQQQRVTLNAQGENWLFFGNPSFENDFLYQLELQKFHDNGVLNRIDLAFSRDQKQKIYVQHRIKQNDQAIWKQLQNGAYLYICGNKDYMAKDVEAELIALIEKFGNKTNEQAHNYLTELKRNSRYQKDVY